MCDNGLFLQVSQNTSVMRPNLIKSRKHKCPNPLLIILNFVLSVQVDE